MKKLLRKWYQFKADNIIKLMEVAPIGMVLFLYDIGLHLNEVAISKGLWLD